MHCQYCQRPAKSKVSNQQHEIRCKVNPSPIKIKPSYGMLGKKGANQFSKAAREGLPLPLMTPESKAKALETRRQNGTLKHSEESKKKTSASMKLAVIRNPDAYTSSNRGRAKQIIYDGIKFIGQWEVDFYQWAKNNGLSPKRPAAGFKYMWNGERTYYPDFYIESLNLYVEVKGYETDRDRQKWLQFPEQLRIIKEAEIKQIRNGTFLGL